MINPMKTKAALILNLFIGLCHLLISTDVQAQNVAVHVSGIRSDKGKIVLNIFRTDQSYQEEKPFKQLEFDKKQLANGTVTLNCTLQPGSYGITLLDDENQNGKLDKNMVRMPREGFGFSNFYMEKLKKPAFDDFKIEIKNNDNKVKIKTKYL